jgi:hypothetical protein
VTDADDNDDDDDDDVYAQFIDQMKTEYPK